MMINLPVAAVSLRRRILELGDWVSETSEADEGLESMTLPSTTGNWTEAMAAASARVEHLRGVFYNGSRAMLSGAIGDIR